MKILCLADTHIFNRDSFDFIQNEVKSLLSIYNPDVILIAGDVFESDYKVSTSKFQYCFSDKIPVVFCLGNHEFCYRDINRTTSIYSEVNKDNIYCLDICGKFTLQDVTFIGNMLGYDGSMKDIPEQKIEDFSNGLGGKWLDVTIHGWRELWKKQCQQYVSQIKQEYAACKSAKKILLTHTVPHKRLNLHNDNNPCNAYSGIANFLETLLFDYSVCGHTHKRSIGQIINNCCCVNVGNDILHTNQMEHFFFEI